MKSLQTQREKTAHRYSIGEEIANSVTHGIGAAASIAAMSILIFIASQHGDPWRIVSFSIYGATLFILYLASTLYHAFTHEKTKRFFRLMDHSSIFLLIAGTYTPVTLVAMRGGWGWTLFCLIWTMAFSGLVFELFYIGKHKWISLIIYVAMGWLAVIAIKPMIAMLPDGMMKWIVLGGFFYTLGIAFYIWKQMPYHHAIWHLFVLAGSAMHFFGFVFYLAHQPA
jgi:hemolysin III